MQLLRIKLPVIANCSHYLFPYHAKTCDIRQQALSAFIQMNEFIWKVTACPSISSPKPLMTVAK